MFQAATDDGTAQQHGVLPQSLASGRRCILLNGLSEHLFVVGSPIWELDYVVAYFDTLIIQANCSLCRSYIVCKTRTGTSVLHGSTG